MVITQPPLLGHHHFKGVYCADLPKVHRRSLFLDRVLQRWGVPSGAHAGWRDKKHPLGSNPGSQRPEHALRVCAAGPGCRRCLVRTWRELGRDSGAGRWLSRDFPATAAQDSFFFFFSFSQEAATTAAAAGGEEEKEASPARAHAADRLSGRSVPALMSPRSASPAVPRREWGTEPSADGEWPHVSRLSSQLSRQPAGGCPRRCVLNYLEAGGGAPRRRRFPPRPAGGARPRWWGGGPRSALCCSGGRERGVAAAAGAGGGGCE